MAHESADSDTTVGSPEKSSETEQAPPNRGEEPAASRRPNLFRTLSHRWFFSTERRYQMFQTIVGGTIANLIAAGIIASIAIASGGLRITFSWSWNFFWETLPITGAIGFVVGIVATIVSHSDPEEDLGWPASIGIGLYAAAGTAFLWALVVTFIDALGFSIVHVNTK